MSKGMRQVVVCAGILALAAAFAASAEAQTTITIGQEYFDSGTGTWTLSAPMGGVGWAMDPPPDSSTPNSLNYNNGTDYNSGATNSGTARSPAYPVASTTYTTFRIAFSCRRITELDMGLYRANNHDTCLINVYDSGGTINRIQLLDLNLVTGGSTGIAGYTGMDCPIGSGTNWHPHTLNIAVPAGTVSVEFAFDTVDATFNDRTEGGWYIDDLLITAVDPGGGGTPPPPGGTYEGPGYYDPNGIYIGLPDGGIAPPPYVPTGGTTPGIEPGSTNADGIYVGTQGSAGGTSGGDSDDKCGLIGIEFLLLLGLFRRRR